VKRRAGRPSNSRAGSAAVVASHLAQGRARVRVGPPPQGRPHGSCDNRSARSAVPTSLRGRRADRLTHSTKPASSGTGPVPASTMRCAMSAGLRLGGTRSPAASAMVRKRSWTPSGVVKSSACKWPSGAGRLDGTMPATQHGITWAPPSQPPPLSKFTHGEGTLFGEATTSRTADARSASMIRSLQGSPGRIYARSEALKKLAPPSA
jgi:hypothetical protein